jgi:hypothetical protein
MTQIARKSFLAGLGASFSALLPQAASAQFIDPSSILRNAKRRVERNVRDAAEEAVGRTLFPLEDEANQFFRAYPKFDGTDFGPFAAMT